jgi:hypothetical protein
MPQPIPHTQIPTYSSDSIDIYSRTSHSSSMLSGRGTYTPAERPTRPQLSSHEAKIKIKAYTGVELTYLMSAP